MQISNGSAEREKRKYNIQICLYLRIIIFFFDIKKNCFYKNQIRFLSNLINNNTDSKIAIQKQSSFFEFCIIIVICFAILTVVTKRIEIAVAVITRIVIDFASNIDRLSDSIITSAFRIVYFVYINIFCISSLFRNYSDYDFVDKYIRVRIVKLDSSIEQDI